MKTGIVLEGGGTRDNYSAGVLEFLLEKKFMPDLVVGVSAGATVGMSYISMQKDRARATHQDYINDKRYAGLGCILREHSVYGMKFNFDTLPNELCPFDYDTFISNPCDFHIVTIEAESGKLVYFSKKDIPRGDYSIIKASASLPVFSPAVKIGDKHYYDGGTADPIPVRYALSQGCDKVLVVLTQPDGYRKKPQKGRLLYKLALHKYPQLIRAIQRRHIVYNETLDFIKKAEQDGRVIVLRPSVDLGAKRFCLDREKLERLYRLGMDDAQSKWSIISSIFQNGGADT